LLSLTHLSLRVLNFGDLAERLVDETPNLERLEVRDWPETWFTDECLRQVARLPRLQSLSAPGRLLTDDGLLCLRDKPLRELNLVRCDQLTCVDVLRTLPCLAELRLFGRGVSESMLSALWDAMPSLVKITRK
jgi:hypothetical protein